MSYGTPPGSQRRPVYIAGNSATNTPRKQSTHSTPSGSVPHSQQASSSRNGRPSVRSARSSLDSASAYQRFDEVTWLVDLSSRIEDALQSPVTIPGLRSSSGTLASASATPRSRVRLPQPSKEFRDLRYSLQHSRRDPDASSHSVDIGSDREEVLPVLKTPASVWVKQAQSDFDRKRFELEQSRQHLEAAEEPNKEPSPVVDSAVERSLLAARSLQELMTSGGMEAEDGESPPHFAELLENAEAFPTATEAGPSALFEAHRDSQGALDIESVLQHRAELVRQSANQSNSSSERSSMLDLAPSQPQKPIIEMLDADQQQDQLQADDLTRPDSRDPDTPPAPQLAFVDGASRFVTDDVADQADGEELSQRDSESDNQEEDEEEESGQQAIGLRNTHVDASDEDLEEEEDDEEEDEEEEEEDDDDELSEGDGNTRDLLFDGPVGDEDEPIVLSDSDDEEEELLQDQEVAEDESDDDPSPSASYPSDGDVEDDESGYPQSTDAMQQLIIKALGEDSQLSQSIINGQKNDDIDARVDLHEDAMPEDEVEEDEFDEGLQWSTLEQEHDEDAPLTYPGSAFPNTAATSSGFVSASQLYTAQDLAASAPLVQSRVSETDMEPQTTFKPIDPELLEASMVDYNANGEDPTEDMPTTAGPMPIDRISADDYPIASEAVYDRADQIEQPDEALGVEPDDRANDNRQSLQDDVQGEEFVAEDMDVEKQTEQLAELINRGSETAFAEAIVPPGDEEADEHPTEQVSAATAVLATLPEELEDPLKLAQLREVTQHSAASSVSVAGSDEHKIPQIEPVSKDDTETIHADKATEELPVALEQHDTLDASLSSALSSADTSLVDSGADDYRDEQPSVRAEQQDTEDVNLNPPIPTADSFASEPVTQNRVEVAIPSHDVLEADVEDNNDNDTEREDFADEEIVRVRSSSRSNDQRWEPFQVDETEQALPENDNAPPVDEAAVPDDDSVESGDLADLDRPSELRPISPSETLLVKPGQELADAAAKTISATPELLKRKVDDDAKQGDRNPADDAKPSDPKRVKLDFDAQTDGGIAPSSGETTEQKALQVEDAPKHLVPPSPASSDRRSTSSFTPSANRHGHRHIHGAQRNLFSQLGQAVSGVANSLVSPIKALQPMFPIEEAAETVEDEEHDEASNGQKSSPRISEDAKFTITTRSHCLYRQLQLRNVRGRPIFVVPGCSINHEEARREGADDIGEATEQTSDNWVDVDPDLLPQDVHHVLSRILGLQILREGIFAEPDSAAARLLDELDAEQSVKTAPSLPELVSATDGGTDGDKRDVQSVHGADDDETEDAAAEAVALATRSRRSGSTLSTGSQHRTPRKSNPRSAQADYLPDEDRKQLHHKRHDSAPDTGDLSIASLEGDEAREESANESVHEEIEPIRTRASTRKRGRQESGQEEPKSEKITDPSTVSQAADTTSRKRRSKRGGAAQDTTPTFDSRVGTLAQEEQRTSPVHASDDSKPLAEAPNSDEAKPENGDAVDEDEVLDELGVEESGPEPEAQSLKEESGEKAEVVIPRAERDATPKSPKKSTAIASKKRPRRSDRGPSSPKRDPPSPVKTPPRKSARNKKLKL